MFLFLTFHHVVMAANFVDQLPIEDISVGDFYHPYNVDKVLFQKTGFLLVVIRVGL